MPKQNDAYKLRRELLRTRREVKSRIFTTRQAFATILNKNLASTVIDYQVTIQFSEGKLSSELEELVKSSMGWRTSQVPKARLIAENLSPHILLDAIDANDTALLENIVDADGSRILSKSDAQEVLTTLKVWNSYVAIQRCVFEDRPQIKVGKAMKGLSGAVTYQVRDFARLSLGQQQSILLSILLFSKSKTPLIIDQPEDNLDSEFIYKTLISCLRVIKEHRQVVVVTHNANIAVLGDAELIIPLRGASDLALIRDRGSIDTEETKEIVCTILEGGKRAFIRRKEVYGH